MKHANPTSHTSDHHTVPITIISRHHAWRTLSGVKTNDYYTYRHAIQNGCHLQRASFDLRHPEEMVCDLSNLERIYDGMTEQAVVRIWDYLDVWTRNWAHGEICRVRGDGLSPEIAIAGPSKSRLIEVKKSLIKQAFLHLRKGIFPTNEPGAVRGINKDLPLINMSDATLNFHNKFCAFYSRYISHEHWNSSSSLNTRFIYEDHDIWHEIEQISNNKLFLLSAGLPLALGYMTATGDSNVFFSEIHRQNDAGMLSRNNAFRDIFPTPPLTDESWLIIDKSYTGGSLIQAANLIRSTLGYKVNIKTLALFPKSFGAFMSADYAVYAGRLYEVKTHASTGQKPLAQTTYNEPST
ncbi:hypothetical protein [Pseudomonas sp. Z1-14]|uniref:hypothetical protein n=1 Tax=Pseudomonas sp. Z1-14 TaxID=2817409 RepID=UPI003DA944D3